MKIENNFIEEISIEEFAEKNDLVMQVFERRVPITNPNRFYACFKHCEEKGDGVLIGTYGNGVTPDLAINEYVKMISLKTLVIDAYSDSRKEIKVPRLRILP